MLASLFEFGTASAGVGARPSRVAEPSPADWLEPGPGVTETPAAQIDFDGDRVGIWTAGPASDCALERANSRMTDGDWEEVDRLRHPAARARSIAARAQLRTALSHAVDGEVPPAAWRFARTSFGRPCLHPDLPAVHFSVSHTQALSVIAVSLDRPVGVDIEAQHGSTDEAFARAFLSRRELNALRRLPEARRHQDVIRFWTLKEAYAKLLGIGLAADFRSFEFHLDPAQLMSHCEAAEEGRRTCFRTWQVSSSSGTSHLALAVGQPQARRFH